MKSNEYFDLAKIDQDIIPGILQSLIYVTPGVLATINPAIAIPMVLLNALFSGVSNNSTNRLINELQEQYDSLELRGVITQEYLESDSYRDLMVEILEKINRINTDEKRKCVGRIYADVVGSKKIYEFCEEKYCLDILCKIDTHQVNILKYITSVGRLDEIGEWKKFHIGFVQFILNKTKMEMVSLLIDKADPIGKTIEKYAFKYLANQLEQMGLITMGNGLDDYENDSSHLVTAEHKAASVAITPLGKTFLKYLNTTI